MKNAFKLGFLALALSLSVVACSEKKAESTDSTTVDSSVVDTTVKDTMAKDTMMTDTTKKM
ncbi:hypothetical protein [Pedobacter mendelii]|uniref:Coproporphyrinogen III oxidase n=1 Tax=Pedobacter mendelii TaxID=1908240 RepID=A0ABQ2BG99_9SPHI|nr:hypothetical protein [Pedobacter mendelii]GGI25536.1 hypothetical protein GCM10008119_18150 [Pedobacter mendelii]